MKCWFRHSPEVTTGQESSKRDEKGEINEYEVWTQRWVDKLKKMESKARKEVRYGEMNRFGAIHYLIGIPRRGVDKGWPDAIYETGESLVRFLYENSKKAGYINEDSSIDEFLQEARKWRGLVP